MTRDDGILTVIEVAAVGRAAVYGPSRAMAFWGAVLCAGAMVVLCEAPWSIVAAFLLPLLVALHLTRRGLDDSQLSWAVPLVGYATTFLIGVGLSASNENVQTTVEIVGAGVCATFTAWGSWYVCSALLPTIHRAGWRNGHVVAGVACNVVLGTLVASGAYASYSAKTRPAPQPAGLADLGQIAAEPGIVGPRPVWIDTDPACGAGMTADVDDCWALLAAIRSPELAILGISTVFGNQDGARASALAQHIMPRLTQGTRLGENPPTVYEGSPGEGGRTWPPTAASRALASALGQRPMTIIALGPLTNLATVIRHDPNVVKRIERIVVVGGKRPGQLFHPGHRWWVHFGDFNVSHDPAAADMVLYSGVPITLVSFDLATKLLVTKSDLERLSAGDDSARWLSQVSQPWLSFWNTMVGKPGFHPFDVLAVTYAAMPDLFRCRPMPARIGFNLFLAPFGMGRDLEVATDIHGPVVTDCFDLDPAIKHRLLVRLLSPPSALSGMGTAL